MLVAIISDIHDNLANLQKFLTWSKTNKIKQLFIIGDTGSAETIKIITGKFAGQIHLVLGNADFQEIKSLKNFAHLEIYDSFTDIQLDHKKIYLTHHPGDIKKMAIANQYDFIFYGHTHKPWIEQIGQTIIANPGTLAGMFSKATFAIWDTKNSEIRLKLLELI